jgi:hypothetical protein
MQLLDRMRLDLLQSPAVGESSQPPGRCECAAAMCIAAAALTAVAAAAVVAAGSAAAAAPPPAPPPPPPATFSPCASPPTPLQVWNFTGAASSPGHFQLLANQTLCLMPAACASAAGTPLVVAPCASAAPTPCALWAYDTFTYFTLTNGASGLLVTDGGSGAPATQAAAAGTPAQQFQAATGGGGGPVIPADDSSLCLTAPSVRGGDALRGGG